jgi:hypothetical protein
LLYDLRIRQFALRSALLIAGALACALGLHVLARWNASRTRRGRRRAGLCIACGYDLRASSGRCPECGRAMTVR